MKDRCGVGLMRLVGLAVALASVGVLAGCSRTPPASTDAVPFVEPPPGDVELPGSGGRIAFCGREQETLDIYVISGDGQVLSNLTNSPTNDKCPAWSPDGNSIAFTRMGDKGDNLYVMGDDGRDLRRLTTGPGGDFDPVWSPDGLKIAFNRYLDDGGFELWVLNADGSGLTKTASGIAGGDCDAGPQAPRWSPDGTRIMCERLVGRGRPHVYLVNPDGSEMTDISESLATAEGARWAPNGAAIALQGAEKDRPSDIYVLRAYASELTNITNTPDAEFNIAWSPDSKRIAFCRSKDKEFAICVASADGRGLVTLLAAPEIGLEDVTTYPQWSPDGKKLAFVLLSSEERGDLYVVNADGSELTNLTNSPEDEATPVWSLSGSKLVFTRITDDKDDLCVIHVDGSKLVNLTNGKIAAFDPTWCPHCGG